MTNRLKDKAALVTGAGSIAPGWGNGKAAAVLFAREGAKVFAVDINPQAVNETKSIIEAEGGACETFAADVSKADQVAALVDTCLRSFGRIDILHNNVGIVELGGPVEASEESWDRVHSVNLKSMFLTCKYVLPQMEKQGSGAIVNISSIAGTHWLGIPYISYATSKAAIVQFTRVVALQYAAKGIRVNCILPGLMNTPMVLASLREVYGDDTEELVARREAQCPMGHMGTAWDVAYAALFLVSDEARYITGAQLVVDGGLSAKCV